MKLTAKPTSRDGIVEVTDMVGRPIEGLRRPSTQQPDDSIVEIEVIVHDEAGRPQLGFPNDHKPEPIELDPTGPIKLGLRINRGLLVPYDLVTGEAVEGVRDVQVYQDLDDLTTMVIRLVAYEPSKDEPQLPHGHGLEAWADGIRRLRAQRDERRRAAEDALGEMLREYETEFGEPYGRMPNRAGAETTTTAGDVIEEVRRDIVERLVRRTLPSN